MHTRKSVLTACLIVCVTLSACGRAGSDSVTLTSKDYGSTVHIKQGGTLTVILEGNPTTGYTWEPAPNSSEQLAQQGEPEFKPDSSAVGSGGKMTLQFKAGEPGTYPLKLIYHRTFEPNVPPAQTFEATVIVDR
ncbi:MAG TPA: protease inhibitor I42 family protein [Anaerolineales bacterium]|nr:protease inhibitor I42 family protein [Anaerolineales bacterium]